MRLTTARYYTPSGRSIQAKGISPDIEVLQDVPDELKAKADTKGEASLRGHLKGDEGKEQTGSQSYIPPEPKNDKALNMALDLLRGTQVNSAFPANSKAPVPDSTPAGRQSIVRGGQTATPIVSGREGKFKKCILRPHRRYVAIQRANITCSTPPKKTRWIPRCGTGRSEHSARPNQK